MLGLNLFTMIECPFCNRARSLENEEQIKIAQSRANWTEETICQSCDRKFTFIEGIIQGIISENIFSEWSFISDIKLFGNVEINVGKTHTVELEQSVPIINKIYLTCMNSYADVSHVYNSGKSFRIISSYVDGGTPLGEKQTVSWLLYGRSADLAISIWRRLLVLAKEEILQKQYALALLSCAIAFESFIDSLLDELFRSKGIVAEASDVILETIPSIYPKVYKLLNYMDGVIFKDYKEINKKWQKVVEKRNLIAHGSDINIGAGEANDSFETVIRGIFYILQHTSTIPN
jgi:uncharacterized protein YbaR (Trm112 family)